jgi:hypothetical protein
MADDYCHRSEFLNVAEAKASRTIKLCAPAYTPERMLVASIPERTANYYIVDPQPRDVVMLLRLVRTLAEREGRRTMR